MKVIKNILIFGSILILSYFLSPLAGQIYDKLFPSITGSFVNFTPLIGIPLAYIFFTVLLFTLLGGQKKYWWITIVLIPALLFEMYFDFAHIYFPIIIGLAGWAIGWVILKAYQTATKRKV